MLSTFCGLQGDAKSHAQRRSGVRSTWVLLLTPALGSPRTSARAKSAACPPGRRKCAPCAQDYVSPYIAACCSSAYQHSCTMLTEAEAEARSRVIEEYSQLYKLAEYENAFRASGVSLPSSRLALPLKNILSTSKKAWAAAFTCFNHC